MYLDIQGVSRYKGSIWIYCIYVYIMYMDIKGVYGYKGYLDIQGVSGYKRVFKGLRIVVRLITIRS